MYFAAPILALVATASASAILPRKCHDQWWTWHQNRQLAYETVDKICNNASTTGTVSGTFKAHQKKAWCELGNPCADCIKPYANYIMFSVQWTREDAPPGPLSDEDCKLRLKNEVGGCNSGGQGTTADWWFG
jgi:hypothetical protein